MKGVIHVQAITCDVLIGGDRVALRAHCGLAGSVVVSMPLPVFQRAARDARDARGTPWPEAVRGTANTSPKNVYAPVNGVIPRAPSGRGRRGHLPPARLAAYEMARRLYETEGLPITQAVACVGVAKNAFRTWLRIQRAAERKAFA